MISYPLSSSADHAIFWSKQLVRISIALPPDQFLCSEAANLRYTNLWDPVPVAVWLLEAIGSDQGVRVVVVVDCRPIGWLGC